MVQRASTRLLASLCGAVLFALNWFAAHELFFTEYTDRVITGDAAFISISRYMLDHRHDSAWWPIWYNGIPGRNAYPPLLHQIVAHLAKLEHVSPALAHHQFAVIVYALAPLALFVMVFRLSGMLSTALTAGLGFSLLSPSTLLIPWVRVSAGGWFGPWRLSVLEAYGDAPHMFGLALMPLTILALDRALARRSGWRYLLAALLVAAVLLTNWLGALALALSIAVYLLATTENWQQLSRWWLTAGVGVAGYLMASPWIPPSTIELIRVNGQLDEGDFRADMRAFPLRLLVFMAVFALLKYGFSQRRTPREVQLAIFLLVLPGSIPLLSEYAGKALFPMPHRYQWEMDLALWFCAALLATYVSARLPRPAVYLAIAGALLFGGWQLRAYRAYSAALVKPIDMTTTVEYHVADWLKRNRPNSRVFAIGTVAYWLNNFSDVQQVSGGFDPGTPNVPNRMALNAIQTDTDASEHGAATALLWLRAMGADLAIVGGPKTRAPFRIFRDPQKFDRFAHKIWSEGDDFIYEIPRRSRSIAQVVPRASLAKSVTEPEMRRYVGALEDTALPTAEFAWCSGREASITGDVPAGDVVSVQINYDPGWHAEVSGASRPILRDGLGLMAIDTGCNGTCSVTIRYEGGIEDRLTGSASILTLFLLAALAGRDALTGLRRS